MPNPYQFDEKSTYSTTSRGDRARRKARERLRPRAVRYVIAASVALVLACYWWFSTEAVRSKSVTFEEITNVTGGYCAWQFGDFRVRAEAGILAQRWAALGITGGDWHPPARDETAWLTSNSAELADEFFFRAGNNFDTLLERTRAISALSAVGLGAILFLWARGLLGVGPALAAVILFACSPLVLAHGPLATSDMPAAFLFTASVVSFWALLHRVTWKTVSASVFSCAGLLVTTYAGFQVLPMLLLLWIAQLATRRPTVVVVVKRTWRTARRWRRALIQLGLVLAHAAIAWGVIWACYDFRYSLFADTPLVDGKPAAHPAVDWKSLAARAGSSGRLLDAVRDLHGLPEAYLIGLYTASAGPAQPNVFCHGKFASGCWPSFYPYCFMIKTPLTLLALMTLGAGALVATKWRRRRETWRQHGRRIGKALYRGTPCIVLWLAYWLFAITGSTERGERHLLPTYPAMLMLAGSAASWLDKKPHRPRRRKRRPENESETGELLAPAVEAPQHKKRRKSPAWRALRRFVFGGTSSRRKHKTSSHEPVSSHGPHKKVESWMQLDPSPQPKLVAVTAVKDKTKLPKLTFQLVRRVGASRSPALALVALVFAAIYLREAAHFWPNYLAYFNRLAGGSAHGYEYLVDSSLDWGQELPALRRWIDEQGLQDTSASSERAVYLSYYGVGRPERYGVNVELLPCYYERAVRIPRPLREGVYCISATMLQNVYTLFPGPWNETYETVYQKLIKELSDFDRTAGNHEARNQLVASNPQRWTEVFRYYEQARFARLCSYLRHRRPSAQINYSILIYRLFRDDVSRALNGPPIEFGPSRDPVGIRIRAAAP